MIHFHKFNDFVLKTRQNYSNISSQNGLLQLNMYSQQPLELSTMFICFQIDFNNNLIFVSFHFIQVKLEFYLFIRF